MDDHPLMTKVTEPLDDSNRKTPKKKKKAANGKPMKASSSTTQQKSRKPVKGMTAMKVHGKIGKAKSTAKAKAKSTAKSSKGTLTMATVQPVAPNAFIGGSRGVNRRRGVHSIRVGSDCSGWCSEVLAIETATNLPYDHLFASEKAKPIRTSFAIDMTYCNQPAQLKISHRSVAEKHKWFLVFSVCAPGGIHPGPATPGIYRELDGIQIRNLFTRLCKSGSGRCGMTGTLHSVSQGNTFGGIP